MSTPPCAVYYAMSREKLRIMLRVRVLGDIGDAPIRYRFLVTLADIARYRRAASLAHEPLLALQRARIFHVAIKRFAVAVQLLMSPSRVR